MIAVHPAGDYAHRQPLAYAPLRAACTDRIRLVGSPAEADVIVLAHPKDLTAHGPVLTAGMGADQRLVLLSEEPLWDTVWGPDPMAAHVPCARRRVAQLTHQTSGIFAFARIPYFLLTDHAFYVRYAGWFARNAARAPADWAADWAARPLDLVFAAEYRDEARFDVGFDGGRLRGLGRWRTQVALACKSPAMVRTGWGWNTLPRRQDLPDWHLEKFLDYDGRARMVSALENTHQRHYVSEKIFDAFAMGAVPLYAAAPDHRVWDLVPREAVLNLWDLSPEEARTAIADFTPDARFWASYAQAQADLAARFARPAAFLQETARLAGALVTAFHEVLAAPDRD